MCERNGWEYEEFPDCWMDNETCRRRLMQERLEREQVELMTAAVIRMIPDFVDLCTRQDPDPTVGPAERLGEALRGIVDVQCHDQPYEVTKTDGTTVMIKEGKGTLSGVHLQGVETGGLPAIHYASAGRSHGFQRRRHFTMLHELGHLVQNEDREMSKLLRAQRVADRTVFEENCCNLFASHSLMPDVLVNRYIDWPVHVDGIQDLYDHCFASRAAVAVRAAAMMPGPGRVMVRDASGTTSHVAESLFIRIWDIVNGQEAKKKGLSPARLRRMPMPGSGQVVNECGRWFAVSYRTATGRTTGRTQS